MKNLKIGEISYSGQKQGENMKIGKFPWESGRLGSYDLSKLRKEKGRRKGIKRRGRKGERRQKGRFQAYESFFYT